MQGLFSDEELKELIPAVLDGDLEVAEDLFRGMHSHLMAFLHLLGVDGDQIDDLAQEICLKVYSNLRRYDRKYPFLPWMRTIARNTCRNYIRDAKRLGDRHSAFANYVQTRMLQDAKDAEDKDGTARVDALKDCVEKLSEPHRELVLLRYAKGLNSQEIAERIRKTPVAVRRTLSRIYQGLRACMEGALES